MLAITLGLAVLVGVALGLLGGGGSILMVPLLAYVTGLNAQQAVAMSLLVVGTSSAVAAITHARAGRIRWRVATWFGVAAMSGAYSGGLLAQFVSATGLLVTFAVVMSAAGIAMLRGRNETATAGPGAPPRLIKMIVLGVAVGAFSGLVGAGGGFLLVPALALLAGLAMPVAVGTSLVVISVQSFAGFAGHLATAPIDWRLAGMVTVAAVFGALVGGRITKFVDSVTLRSMFGWFVILTASAILAQEIHPAVGAAVAGLTLLAAAISFACTRWAHCPLRRLMHRKPATALV